MTAAAAPKAGARAATAAAPSSGARAAVQAVKGVVRHEEVSKVSSGAIGFAGFH